MLKNKRIVLGVTGSIAAYKACELVRRLRDLHCEVQVVMTAAACEFITPLSLQALSGQAVRVNLFDAHAEAGMDHISLARSADMIIIAPASANFMARLAHGYADDLLTALCLAREATTPVCLAPAMNQGMWHNPATQHNAHLLTQRGIHILGPESGEQACGEIGSGRLLEIPSLLMALEQVIAPKPLAGCKTLITAGPTREALDPVRYLSNHSSGKMGYALAHAAVCAGAQVTLVSGPTRLACPYGVECIHVTTAQQMHDAVMQRIQDQALFIATAAVSDYQPLSVAAQKLKKTKDTLILNLQKTPDILANVAALQKKRPFTVGFAAETHALEHYAQDKLIHKRLDMIAANDVSQGRAFDAPDNALSVFWQDGKHYFPLQAKTELAHALIALIAQVMQRT